LGQSEIILKSALKKFSHLINNGHWSHNRIIFVIAQKNSIANLWSPTWIIENFWLLVNVRLDYWNFLVINYGNWKLVTKFFISITIRFMATLPCCDLGWPYYYYINVMQGCIYIQIRPSHHDICTDVVITLAQSSIQACITWLKKSRKGRVEW